mgnify:CR=1 FL=1
MAVPKRKVSRSRGGLRASHKSLARRQLYECPQCNQQILPHTVCVHCGFYRKRVEIKTHEDEI